MVELPLALKRVKQIEETTKRPEKREEERQRTETIVKRSTPGRKRRGPRETRPTSQETKPISKTRIEAVEKQIETTKKVQEEAKRVFEDQETPTPEIPERRTPGESVRATISVTAVKTEAEAQRERAASQRVSAFQPRTAEDRLALLETRVGTAEAEAQRAFREGRPLKGIAKSALPFGVGVAETVASPIIFGAKAFQFGVEALKDEPEPSRDIDIVFRSPLIESTDKPFREDVLFPNVPEADVGFRPTTTQPSRLAGNIAVILGPAAIAQEAKLGAGFLSKPKFKGTPKTSGIVSDVQIKGLGKRKGTTLAETLKGDLTTPQAGIQLRFRESLRGVKGLKGQTVKTNVFISPGGKITRIQETSTKFITTVQRSPLDDFSTTTIISKKTGKVVKEIINPKLSGDDLLLPEIFRSAPKRTSKTLKGGDLFQTVEESALFGGGTKISSKQRLVGELGVKAEVVSRTKVTKKAAQLRQQLLKVRTTEGKPLDIIINPKAEALKTRLLAGKGPDLQLDKLKSFNIPTGTKITVEPSKITKETGTLQRFIKPATAETEFSSIVTVKGRLVPKPVTLGKRLFPGKKATGLLTSKEQIRKISPEVEAFGDTIKIPKSVLLPSGKTEVSKLISATAPTSVLREQRETLTGTTQRKVLSLRTEKALDKDLRKTLKKELVKKEILVPKGKVKKRLRTKTLTKQLTKQRAILKQLTKTTQTSRPATTTRTRVGFPSIKPAGGFFFFPAALPSFDVRPKEGFFTEVKVGGQFRRLSGDLTTKETALSRGARFVIGTPAATFRVKKGIGKITDLTTDTFFKQRQRQFRSPIRKGKKVESNLFIEKSKFRIDTPGELRGITFKGIRAKREKKRRNPFKNLLGRRRVI